MLDDLFIVLGIKGYVDYAEYESFSKSEIYYATRLKDNAVYDARKEYDLPENAPSAVLKDEEVALYYGQNKQNEHRTKRSAYWDDENKRYSSSYPIILNSLQRK